MTTGQKITIAVDQSDKTQKEIASAIKISPSLLSQWKHDEVEPPMSKLHKLAIYLGVSIISLLDDEYLSKLSKNQDDNNNEEYIEESSSEYIVFPVIGEIAAGYDKIAIEDWDGETIPIHIDNLKGRPKNDFMVLEVKGNSMFPEFQNGDKVLILKQSSMDYSGQVGAVIYGECATLKKVEYKNGENWLKLVPINPNYETAIIEGDAIQDCWILGIPKMLIREYEQ